MKNPPRKYMSIDYRGGSYTVTSPRGCIVDASANVGYLTSVILSECGSGLDNTFFQTMPSNERYTLRFSSRAKKSLGGKRIDVIKAIVDYHNQSADNFLAGDNALSYIRYHTKKLEDLEIMLRNEQEMNHAHR